MEHHVSFTAEAQSDMEGLSRHTVKIILDWVQRYLEKSEDPRKRGRAMQDGLDWIWRYRIGRYQLMAVIRVGEILIMRVDGGKEIKTQD